jgi:O-antigen biosynthesis protein WbqP
VEIKMIYKTFVKKKIDIILSLVALIVLSPIFLILIVLIKLDSKGPIFFKQRRIGKDKAEFYILKFRTMKIGTPKDTPTHLLEDPESFITRVGKFLRKSSLDELPQIFNILRGEMSIIGPRPALWNQYDLIDERDKYGANDIYPGLTGWAQINGRDELPIDIKAKLDGKYVKEMSLIFDIKVFFMTIFSVLRSDGIHEGSNINKKENSSETKKEFVQ